MQEGMTVDKKRAFEEFLANGRVCQDAGRRLEKDVQQLLGRVTDVALGLRIPKDALFHLLGFLVRLKRELLPHKGRHPPKGGHLVPIQLA